MENIYLIWWLSEIEHQRIAREGFMLRLLRDCPGYIQTGWIELAGQEGRGQLWIAPELRAGVDWADTRAGRLVAGIAGRSAGDDDERRAERLAAGRAGIVIRAADRRPVFELPGVLTDLELRFVGLE